MRLVLVVAVLAACRGDQGTTPPPSDKWVAVKPPPEPGDEAGQVEADLDKLIRGVAPLEDEVAAKVSRDTLGKWQHALGEARAARGSRDVERMKQALAGLKQIARDAAAEIDGAPAPPLVSRKLYADDVALDGLPLSIAIETIGGVATPVLARGATLPANFSEVFSTAQDDQPSVEVHLVQGERPMVADNRDIGRFQLTGIPPAPRGVPQILVGISIDKHGVLAVTATDKATGKSRAVVLDAGGPALGKAAIAAALADANAHRADDDHARQLSAVELKLDTLLYAEQQLDRDVGKKVAPALHARWQRAMEDARVARTSHDLAKLQLATDALQRVSHDVAAQLYSSAP
jgi:molecular chaperone DnaK (HSP70)